MTKNSKKSIFTVIEMDLQKRQILDPSAHIEQHCFAQKKLCLSSFALQTKVRITASESHVYWKDSEKFLLCLLKRHLEIHTLGDKIPLYALWALRNQSTKVLDLVFATTFWLQPELQPSQPNRLGWIPSSLSSLYLSWLSYIFSNLIRWCWSSWDFWFNS